MRSGSRSQSRRPNSEFRSLRDLNHAVNKILDKVKCIDEKQETMSQLIDEVNAKFVETDFTEEECGPRRE